MDWYKIIRIFSRTIIKTTIQQKDLLQLFAEWMQNWKKKTNLELRTLD